MQVSVQGLISHPIKTDNFERQMQLPNAMNF